MEFFSCLVRANNIIDSNEINWTELDEDQSWIFFSRAALFSKLNLFQSQSVVIMDQKAQDWWGKQTGRGSYLNQVAQGQEACS